jgi:cellulose synthase (UDP-forming)
MGVVQHAPVMNGWERLLAWLLFSLGLVAVGYFFGWWVAPGRVASLPLFVLFSFALWFSIFRMVGNWVALLAMARPVHRPPASGLRVDVVTTAAPGEPVEMFRQTLAALTQMRYPHTTYLLDDSHREELRALCEEMGVRYIRRDRPGEGAKAGNVNHGLTQLTGEFVAIFDPDHVPQPGFLERVLGYFDDPQVGFVQAPQLYRNQNQSLVARGAAEMTYELYGPTLMGLHGLGSPLLFGCHTTFRRAALESIGGYAVHNAEDLRTAMRLYARGWKGVYVPGTLARGLVPSDLAGFLRQQYRWAHSVFDLLFRDYRQLFFGWTLFQRLTFFFVGTYYLVGLAILVNLLLAPWVLLGGVSAVVSTAESFAVHFAPLVAVNVALRWFAQRFYLSPTERGVHVAGMVMLFASCFAHVAGLVAAALNVRVPYLVTAKGRTGQRALLQVWLYAVIAVTSGLALLHSLMAGQSGMWLVWACAVWNMSVMGAVVLIAQEEQGGTDYSEPSYRSQGDAVRRLAGRPVVGAQLSR